MRRRIDWWCVITFTIGVRPIAAMHYSPTRHHQHKAAPLVEWYFGDSTIYFQICASILPWINMLTADTLEQWWWGIIMTVNVFSPTADGVSILVLLFVCWSYFFTIWNLTPSYLCCNIRNRSSRLYSLHSSCHLDSSYGIIDGLRVVHRHLL